jgi:AmmeMemoRadiSam system protein B
MPMQEQRPKIRPGIEMLPVSHQGQPVFLLRDRWGISPDLVLKREAAMIISLLDGVNDLRDIQVMLMRQGGLSLVAMEELRELLEKLDEHFILENQRFRLRKEELSQEFRKALVRPPAHAGSAYPAEPSRLKEYLEALFGSKKQSPAHPYPGSRGRPAGMVLPHIDLERGGSCYAKGYELLKPFLGELDLFVILGTCHLPMETPLCLTDKTFQTPLGDLVCAKELAREVCEAAGLDFFAEELVHKVEHSLEIQVVLLKYLAGQESCNFRILPVLLGGFHRMMEKRELPGAEAALEAGTRALNEVLAGFPGRYCVMASADLAHLGPQFGDPNSVLVSDLGRIEREDLAMLEWVLQGNPDGFYRHVMAEQDRRRICGLPPIYVWLRLMQGRQIHLIDYCQAHHPQCTVTFASLGAW